MTEGGSEEGGASMAPDCSGHRGKVVYRRYESEKQLPAIMGLIDTELSEPYVVYTYRYFLHQWPHLSFLAYPDPGHPQPPCSDQATAPAAETSSSRGSGTSECAPYAASAQARPLSRTQAASTPPSESMSSPSPHTVSSHLPTSTATTSLATGPAPLPPRRLPLPLEAELTSPHPTGVQPVGVIVCKQDVHNGKRLRGYIAMLSVRKDWRGVGVATTLVKIAIDAMTRSGAEEIVLETEVDNTAALSLYERQGFIREKRLYRFYLNGKDSYRLVLPIPPHLVVRPGRPPSPRPPLTMGRGEDGSTGQTGMEKKRWNISDDLVM